MVSMRDENITGKRVVFVGPSPCIQDQNLGKWIDSFDIVVRTNGSIFLLEDEKYRQDYGSKCSVLFLNNQFQRSVTNINIEKLKKRGLEKIYCKKFVFPLYHSIINRGVPIEELGVSPNIQKIRGPFMGTIIIDFIASNAPKEFHITGIDFYSDRKQIYYPGYLPKLKGIVVKKEKTDRSVKQPIHDNYANNLYIHDLISDGKVCVSPAIERALQKKIGGKVG